MASDKARFYLEQQVPELQEYERKQIFTRDEIAAIAKKRSDFEHILNARGSPSAPTPERKKGGSLRNRPCHPSSDRDQKSLRYCSLPMKPSLVTAERLITASVWSTLSYFAAGSGWKCSSGSGLIAAAASR